MNSFKINSNTYAMDALRQLNAVNSKVAMHQARLSTGKRINNAQDDAAAYAVIQKTIARMEALDVSKDNIQNAKSSLQLVEQGQMKQLEILQSIKQKVLQLQDATLTSNQRQSIVNSINSMKEEIVDIGSKLKINGTNLAGEGVEGIQSSSFGQLGSDIDGENANDRFGASVAISSDGKTIAGGAIYNDGGANNSGHVRIYTYNMNSSEWEQKGNDIDGKAASDAASVVALNNSGSRVAIGGPSNDDGAQNAGHVRIFDYVDGSWIQIGADLNGGSIDEEFGSSVDLNSDGNIVAVGSNFPNSNGKARVFKYDNNTWSILGSEINGESSGDNFGRSISIDDSGTRLAVGGSKNDGNGTDSGHVRVFDYINGSWVQIGSDLDGEAAGDNFGHSISLSSDGSRLAVGAHFNDGNGTDSGHARIFEYTNGSWSQIGNDLDSEAAGDRFGSSVSMNSDGSRVAVGGYDNDGGGLNSGHVEVFEYSTDNGWIHVNSNIDGEGPDDHFGTKVALNASGNRLVVGATENDGAANDAGHLRVFNLNHPGTSSTQGITTSFNTGPLVSDTFEYNGFAYTNTSSLSIDIDSNNVADSNDLDQIQSYINQMIFSIQKTGSALERLDHKLESANDHFTAHEAVRSSFEDADFAEEQMELIKAQIMQQTAIAALSQANTAPQIVLSLFQS